MTKTLNGLNLLFNLQKELQHKINIDITSIQFIRLSFIGLITEACEALETVNWKPWKQKQLYNEDEFKKELIDCWHFLINLSLAAHLTADDVIELYKEKNAINILRQKNKY